MTGTTDPDTPGDDTLTRIRERITRGVEFLDQEVPDWRARVDPAHLDMAIPASCIIGQISDDNYGRALEGFERMEPLEDHEYDRGAEYDSMRPWDWALAHGFETDQVLVSYDTLTDLWVGELS